MNYHKYDPNTGIYIESVESETPLDNAVTGYLPELTEFYTVAYLEGAWVSVLRPEFSIIENKIVPNA
jgi:hypothetical protein